MSTAELTTTSYAVLGLLALRPWTTYELAQQMERALGLFWPRARSKLYEEPKKLVAHGLAKASSEAVGKRPRTVYSITAKGRRALAAWVPNPGAGPTIEFEGLTKIFFAEHATRADLMANLDRVREWAEEFSKSGAGISEAYLEGRGGFPERLPWLILVGRFLDSFTTMVDDWAAWATEVVEDWPDDFRHAKPDLVALKTMARHNQALLKRSAERGRSERD
jgi:DNA-binding PadR family transcriptional regulator